MSKGKKKTRKGLGHLVDEEWEIGNALCAEEDRGCVMVACARAEHEMALLLGTFFRTRGSASDARIADLIGTNGQNPHALFGSGWAKASTALAIGLFDESTYSLYDEMRQLRNDFAHHGGGVAITQKAVDQLTQHLDKRESETLAERLGRHREGKSLFGLDPQKHSEPRVAFISAAIELICRIFWIRVALDPPNYSTCVLIARWREGGNLHVIHSGRERPTTLGEETH